MELSVLKVSEITGISRPTIYKYYDQLNKQGLAKKDNKGRVVFTSDAINYLQTIVKNKDFTSNFTIQAKEINQRQSNEKQPIQTNKELVNSLYNDLLNEKDKRINDLTQQIESLQEQLSEIIESNKVLTSTFNNSIERLTTQVNTLQLQLDAPKERKGFFKRLTGK